jgi:signal transduction histidine kinase
MKARWPLWPRTLFGQLLLAVLVALIAALLLGVRLLMADRDHFISMMRSQIMAQRLARIVLVLDHTPVAQRSVLLTALNEPPSMLTPWIRAPQDSAQDRAFTESYNQALGRPAPLQFLIFNHKPMADGLLGPHAHPPALPDADPRQQVNPPHAHGPLPMMIQTRLQDGSILTLRHAPLREEHEWPGRMINLLLILAISVVLLSALVLRRLTRPLAALADAATGLAHNLDQPALTERGPVEIVRAAAAFNRMQRDLRTMLETRDQALAGVSHDLRLPITRLRLRLEKLADKDLCALMQTDLAEMDSMIGQTLDFLRAGKTREAAVRMNLDALAEGVADDFAAQGVTVHLHGEIAQPVNARPQALRRCLSNLLENARRYAGGEIDLTLQRQGSMAEVRVEDRGPGIPEEDRERVFEPYFRLESSRARHTGGSGLGLAIVRAIARAEGGEVTLSAREGGGLCVCLSLPLAIDKPAAPVAARQQ